MKMIIEWLLRHWYLFPLGFLLSLVPAIYLLLEPWPEYEWPYYLVNIGFLFFAFMQLAVAVLCLCRKQKTRFMMVVAAGVFCILVFSVISFFSIFIAGGCDHFGARHPIPAGVHYSIPSDSFNNMKPDVSVETTWMAVRNGVQPGIYRLTCYAQPLRDGEIYVKAYEISTDMELNISFNPIQVAGHIAFSKVINNEVLTFYDGIWGEPYGARIEVWHKETKTGKCNKLTEKVWKVEGWMR